MLTARGKHDSHTSAGRWLPWQPALATRMAEWCCNWGTLGVVVMITACHLLGYVSKERDHKT